MTVKKYPPYAKAIPPDRDFIIICTGSDAWNRVKSKSWFGSLAKTLLPLKDDPSIYKWFFVANKEVIIFSNGATIEPYKRLIELTRTLLAYGALKVLWCIPAYKDTLFLSSEVSQ